MDAGFHATTPQTYATAFARALTLPADECHTMRLRARASSKRFTTAVFAAGWVRELEKPVGIRRVGMRPRGKVEGGSGKEERGREGKVERER